MSVKKEFFAELQRRNVVRAALAHLILFWLLAQVADVILPYLGVVEDPVRWAIITGVALFPVTLVVAWFLEHPWHELTGSRLALDVVVLLVITVAAGSWVVRNIPQFVYTRMNLVVMPFEHDKNDVLAESLSRALAYEIIGLLMKSKSINVIGFESASSPLLAGLNPTRIANRLHVEHVLAGKISAIGRSINISVSLHDRKGKSILNFSIEDKLDNLFSVQDRIASAVADRLNTGDNGAPTPTVATVHCDMPLNRAVLEKYYTARYYIELRNASEAAVEKIRESIVLFKELVEEYPEFSEARSGLAWALLYSGQYDEETIAKEVETLAIAHAEIAYEQCPTLGEAMILLPNQYDHENPWINNEQNFRAAIEMEPHNTENYRRYARHLLEVGRTTDSMAVARNIYLRNPLSVRSILYFAMALNQQHRFDEAEELLEKQSELGGNVPNFARINRRMLKCSKDLECFLDNLPPPLQPYKERISEIYSEPDDANGAENAVDAAMALVTEEPRLVNWFNAAACGTDHLAPLFFEVWDFANANDLYWHWPHVWNTECQIIWATPKFVAFVESAGFVEYWKTVAWADACQPDDESFVCTEKPESLAID